MSTVTPWREFVLCPDLSGMLFQMIRAKSVGDLWGKINQMSFDGRELVVTLAWTTTNDPRERGTTRTEDVREVRILPQATGAYYTSSAGFILRDLNTGSACFICSPRIKLKSQGHRLPPVIVAI